MTVHDQIWTGVNPPSVSYLATWQHGNDKLMARNAPHIPGSVAPLAPPHSTAVQIKVHRPFLMVSAVPSFFQREAAAQLIGSGNGVIAETGAAKVSHWFPLRRRVFVPSAEEGLRVRHVKMTRRETSSARECVGYTTSTAVSVRVYKIWPHHCAGEHALFP